MTTDKQLYILSKLTDPMSSSLDMPSLINTLYQQILWGAFANLLDALLHNQLKILHTLLCIKEHVLVVRAIT